MLRVCTLPTAYSVTDYMTHISVACCLHALITLKQQSGYAHLYVSVQPTHCQTNAQDWKKGGNINTCES